MSSKAAATKREAAVPKGPESDRATTYLAGGRTNQKTRTRDALVAVAADLIRAGKLISVAEVADVARVSRTTAYRYFPTSELLSAQATLRAADVIESRAIDTAAHGPGTAEERVDAVISGSDTMTSSHEAAFRALLRFSVEVNPQDNPGLPRRPPFRKQWLEAALEDLQADLGPKRYARLTGALSLLCGIESLIVLRDICSMKPDEARETKRWAAQLLLRAAREEAAEQPVHHRKAARSKTVPKSKAEPQTSAKRV